MSDKLAFFIVLINNFKLKGVKIKLDVKLNISSIFKSDTSNQEDFIKLFNYKLLKIIMHLESNGGNN